MQSIQKEHGLDDFQKVKKESVLEMVSTLLFIVLGGLRQRSDICKWIVRDMPVHGPGCSLGCGLQSFYHRGSVLAPKAMVLAHTCAVCIQRRRAFMG